MILVSELISKPVLSLGGASIVGTVLNVHFEKTLKKLDFLQLIDESEEEEFCRFLPVRQLISLSEDALVIKMPQPDFNWSKELEDNSPMNCEVFNQDGKRLGKISDISFDGNFKVVSFFIEKQEYSSDQLLNFSKNIVVINDSGKAIKLLKPKMRPPKPSDKEVEVDLANASELFSALKAAVYTQNSALASVDSVPDSHIAFEDPQTAQADSLNIQLPQKICCPPPMPSAKNFSFLLGKRLSSSLFTGEGKLIAGENDLITDDVIMKARKFNKLVQLTLRAV